MESAISRGEKKDPNTTTTNNILDIIYEPPVLRSYSDGTAERSKKVAAPLWESSVVTPLGIASCRAQGHFCSQNTATYLWDTHLEAMSAHLFLAPFHGLVAAVFLFATSIAGLAQMELELPAEEAPAEEAPAAESSDESREAPPEGGLRAVTWDFLHFPGGKRDASDAERESDFDRARDALQRLDPDIFFMQRVRNRTVVGALCQTVEGLKLHSCSEHETGGLVENAIASKLPVLASGWDDWDPTLTGVPRGYTWAVLQLSDGRPLVTVTSRLRQNTGDIQICINQREDAVGQMLRQIAKLKAQYRTELVLVGGSFNTTMAEKRFEYENSLRRFMKFGYHWCWEKVPYLETVSALRDYGYETQAGIDHFFGLNLGKFRGPSGDCKI